jgi:hypothetical protein
MASCHAGRAASPRERAGGRARGQLRARACHRAAPWHRWRRRRITCNFTERRNGSSSAIGHDMISAMSSSVIPSKCSIFCAGDQWRQPGGRSATRGMRGKAMTLPSSVLTPSLRCRLSEEPAIGSGMWRATDADASTLTRLHASPAGEGSLPPAAPKIFGAPPPPPRDCAERALHQAKALARVNAERRRSSSGDDQSRTARRCQTSSITFDQDPRRPSKAIGWCAWLSHAAIGKPPGSACPRRSASANSRRHGRAGSCELHCPGSGRLAMG